MQELIDKILSVVYVKPTVENTMKLGEIIQECEDNGDGEHYIASDICNYLGIEYRYNRAAIKQVIVEHKQTQKNEKI